MDTHHKFVFIIPTYNTERIFKKCLDSVLNQTYTNWRVIYIDDASTDKTYTGVSKYIKNNKLEDKIILIRNAKNMTQSYSRYIGFQLCDDDEICCLLDGDDWLYNNLVLEKLNHFYNNNDVLVTYGNMECYTIRRRHNKTYNIPDYTEDCKKGKKYRITKWTCEALRTGFAKLFKNIPVEQQQDSDGNWLAYVADRSIMYSVLEQSDGKHKKVDFMTYVYNTDNSNLYISGPKYQNNKKIFNSRINIMNHLRSFYTGDTINNNIPKRIIQRDSIDNRIPKRIIQRDSIDNRIDKIYVINLKKDTVKKDVFIKNNSHTNLNFTFVEGVYGKTDNKCNDIFNEYMSKDIGYNGCSKSEKISKRKMVKNLAVVGLLQSYYNVIQDAINNNYQKIIIFEDDVILHKDFSKILLDNLNRIKKYNLIRLGTTCHTINHKNNIYKVRNPYYRTIPTDGSFAIIYDRKVFVPIINKILQYNQPYDNILRELNFSSDYTIYPFIAIAELCVSDNMGARNLLEYSKILKWDLDNFDFKTSLRKVSVVIPIYNNENTIIKSIQSILEQLYDNIEVILVDDCSTDNTVGTIDDFLNTYDGHIQIKFIKHDVNKGCYNAINTGIKAATGNYIAIQKPDIVYLPDCVKDQMEDIIKNNYMISFGNKDNDSVFKPDISIIDIKLFDEYGLYESNDINWVSDIYAKKYNIKIDNFDDFVLKNMDKHGFLFYNNKTILSKFNK
jgi:glycosyltransferase involved in cell wall biosynthesis